MGMGVRKHRKVNCPDCHIRMTPFVCQSAVLDRCDSCNGIWFDENELGIFKSSLEGLDLEKVTIQKAESENILSNCPHCKGLLEERKYDYNSGVIIKTCNKCSGIWLSNADRLKFIDMVKIAKAIRPDLKLAVGTWVKADQERIKNKAYNDRMAIFHKRARFPGTSAHAIRNWFPFVFLYDDNPRSRFHWVTTSIILLNILFLALSWKAKGSFYEGVGFIPQAPTWASLFSHLFIHGGITHLSGNIFFLWTFGDNIEDRLGPIKYLFFYFLCGFGAILTHTFFQPYSDIPVIGASGAISGVMGAYIYFYPHINLKTLVYTHLFDIPAYVYIGGWFMGQLYHSVSYQGQAYSQVAFAAHVGGFLTGLVAAFFVSKLTAEV